MVLSLTTLSAGCGHDTSPGAGTATARGVVQEPGPIATAEPTCIADHPHYASASELVARAELVVRVTATGPSRDDVSYPLSLAEDGSLLPPGEGTTSEE